MKILVLGSKSFLSQEIKHFFCDKNFYYVDRNIVDLNDKNSVYNFFKDNYFDILINTCVVGGKRGHIDNFEVFSTNINMFNNLINVSDRYGKLFNFCSGAAFDREMDISRVLEEDIITRFPKDYYGLSKNIIARESYEHEKIYNFRIFGCFGRYELDTRFIKNSINRINNDLDVVIYKDKYIDYISSEDVCRVLNFYIYNESAYRDINLVYREKYKLSDLGKKIINFKKKNQNVIIQDEELDKEYTGNSTKLESLKINLSGLENSLRNLIC